MVGRKINNELKWCGRNRSSVSRCSTAKFVWKDWGKIKENSVRITDAPTEIRTENLPNTYLKRHRYTNLSGEFPKECLLNQRKLSIHLCYACIFQTSNKISWSHSSGTHFRNQRRKFHSCDHSNTVGCPVNQYRLAASDFKVLHTLLSRGCKSRVQWPVRQREWFYFIQQYLQN
jgi:hypothetical protein